MYIGYEEVEGLEDGEKVVVAVSEDKAKLEEFLEQQKKEAKEWNGFVALHGAYRELFERANGAPPWPLNDQINSAREQWETDVWIPARKEFFERHHRPYEDYIFLRDIPEYSIEQVKVIE